MSKNKLKGNSTIFRHRPYVYGVGFINDSLPQTCWNWSSLSQEPWHSCNVFLRGNFECQMCVYCFFSLSQCEIISVWKHARKDLTMIALTVRVKSLKWLKKKKPPLDVTWTLPCLSGLHVTHAAVSQQQAETIYWNNFKTFIKSESFEVQLLKYLKSPLRCAG